MPGPPYSPHPSFTAKHYSHKLLSRKGIFLLKPVTDIFWSIGPTRKSVILPLFSGKYIPCNALKCLLGISLKSSDWNRVGIWCRWFQSGHLELKQRVKLVEASDIGIWRWSMTIFLHHTLGVQREPLLTKRASKAWNKHIERLKQNPEKPRGFYISASIHFLRFGCIIALDFQEIILFL